MRGGFVLHGSPHSLYTYKVALTLRLSRERFAFRYVSFQRGMHRTAEFRSLSRWGQVPVLQHEGRVLLQSAAILEYLADTLGKFAGTDRDERQHVREWLFWTRIACRRRCSAGTASSSAAAACCRCHTMLRWSSAGAQPARRRLAFSTARSLLPIIWSAVARQSPISAATAISPSPA